jgi:5,5'-dehydrodivanillate O-demethylase
VLKPEENETLTRVGPGTPMGALLRCYWYPLAAEIEMRARWTKRVRLLGEDLVLFKDRSGGFGLIAEACPHRRASLAYGIPTKDGIRCPYHGWKFDGAGACLEQPNEPEGSTFRDKIRTAGYPVARLGGLLWGYLGALPAPLIPRLDGFVVEGTIRAFGQALIPCNWLQIMENSVDSVHTEWLHGAYAEFLREKDGVKYAGSRRSVKLGFEEVDYGIVKRRLFEGQTEDADDWKVGHPLLFPNTLAIGNKDPNWRQYSFQIRVPVDDTHTQHYWYDAFLPRPGAEIPPQLLEDICVYNIPFVDEHGEFMTNFIYAQDIMVWVQQGPIADRSREALGNTDRGVTLYRKLLQRELENVAQNRDPKCVIRDPARNGVIDIALETHMNYRKDGFASHYGRHTLRHAAIFRELEKIYDLRGKDVVTRASFLAAGAALAAAAAQPAHAATPPPTTLKLVVTPSTTLVPLYLGIKQGFFAEQGLRIDIAPGQDTASNVAAAVSGAVDIAFVSTTVLVRGISQGLKIRAISSVEGVIDPKAKDAATAILVNGSSNIKSLKDLSGKTIAVPTLNSGLHLETMADVDNAGGDSKSITFTQVPYAAQSASLSAGRVDAIIIPEPFKTLLIKQGARVIGYPDLDIMANSWVICWIASEAFIQSRTDVVKRFQKANATSLVYAARHIDEAKATIPTIVPTISIEQAKATVLGTIYNPTLDMESVRKYINLLVKYGGLKNPPDPKDVVYAG